MRVVSLVLLGGVMVVCMWVLIWMMCVVGEG